jgi:hypothetical protein
VLGSEQSVVIRAEKGHVKMLIDGEVPQSHNEVIYDLERGSHDRRSQNEEGTGPSQCTAVSASGPVHFDSCGSGGPRGVKVRSAWGYRMLSRRRSGAPVAAPSKADMSSRDASRTRQTTWPVDCRPNLCQVLWILSGSEPLRGALIESASAA